MIGVGDWWVRGGVLGLGLGLQLMVGIGVLSRLRLGSGGQDRGQRQGRRGKETPKQEG